MPHRGHFDRKKIESGPYNSAHTSSHCMHHGCLLCPINCDHTLASFGLTVTESQKCVSSNGNSSSKQALKPALIHLAMVWGIATVVTLKCIHEAVLTHRYFFDGGK